MEIRNETNLIDSFSPQSVLEAFMAGTTDAFIVLDAELNIVTFNEAYTVFNQKIAGKSIVYGNSYVKVINGSPIQFIQSSIQRSLKGHVVKFTEKFSFTDNSTSWYDFEFHPLRNDDSLITGVGIGIFDTTEKHVADEKVRKSEELFKALVMNSADVFQLTDDELRVTYVSDSIKNVLGYETKDIMAHHFFNLIHPDDKVVISSWLHWLMYNKGVARVVEIRIKNKKGDFVYIEINGRNLLGVENIDAIVMNYRDIQAKKIASNALAIAEQRMGLLLNNTKESFIIVNSRLRIVTYNKAAQEHTPFFFSQELRSGMSLLELVGPDDVENIIETFEEVFDGKETERETTFTEADGSLHVYNHVYRPLFSDDNDIVGVFITSTNVTEKRKAEQKLRSSEERYRTIIQESFDAILIKDLNNIITEASPAIEKILGYRPDEIVGVTCINLIHEDYQEIALSTVAKILQSPESEASIDLMMLHKNGHAVWVEMKGKNLHHNKLINAMVIMLRDITQRKEAEELISLSEQRFKGLVQSGADMISIIDEEGFVKYSSPTVKTILGNDPTTDIGKNVFAFIHADDREWVDDSFQDFLHNGTRTLRFGPYRFPNSRGHYRWLETVATNLTDDPAIGGIVINSRDVTETKRLNEEQQSLTNELMRNNQDLQQFSFITSHNLRAPVANLISLLNLFDKQNHAEPFNKVLIEKFEESTVQLNNTLNDLLEVLVLKSNADIVREPLRFSETVELVCKNLGNIIEEQHAELITDFSAINDIEYNKIHLESIFQNLVSNAVKYRSPDRKPVISISSALEENWITVSVQDNGMGIDLERYKDRIFGMYQRFHAGKEGKGLGLYMIKAQLGAMGGKIEVESEQGKGTIFKIYFKN
jgi:PAS domain S-box-containing protein